ncbi:MAG TPA: hypothetical protein PLS12_06170 [Bacteroidales bacterium]|nr:hypothetical protein [Bacteroidales bacterium]
MKYKKNEIISILQANGFISIQSKYDKIHNKILLKKSKNAYKAIFFDYDLI